MRVDNGSAHVINQLESLGQNKTIKAIRCNRVGSAEVGKYGCVRIARVAIEDVHPLDSRAVPIDISGVLDFKRMPPNVGSVALQEVFDVVAIGRIAPVIAPTIAE